MDTILVYGGCDFPQLGSTPTPYKNIVLPCDSGTDKAISSNSNANFPPEQHIKHGVALLTTQ